MDDTKHVTVKVKVQRLKRVATVRVTAEYYRVDNGNLIFRNHVQGGYPQTVAMFAAGVWLEVHREEL